MVDEKLQSHLDSITDNNKIFGTSVRLSSPGIDWTGSSGNLKPESQFYIASTTKLFVTAVILNLAASGRLDLSGKAASYLPDGTMEGLHTYRGKNYSGIITIKQLLSQTSGISDYFEEKRPGKPPLVKKLLDGNDFKWSFDDLLNISREMKPHFPPGKKGKAFYSDTNFQLLGKIIEEITEISFADALDKYIATPLELKSTYLYTDKERLQARSCLFKKRTHKDTHGHDPHSVLTAGLYPQRKN